MAISATPTKPPLSATQPTTPTTPTPARPTIPGRRMALIVRKVTKELLCLKQADDSIQQLFSQENGRVAMVEEYSANPVNTTIMIEIGWLRMSFPEGFRDPYRLVRQDEPENQ